MNTPKLPKNGITIEDAKYWTASWQLENPNKARAFLIPIPDLLELLTELTVLKKNVDGSLSTNPSDHLKEGLRAYMAVGPDDKGSPEERLVLVGAVDVGGVYQDQVLESPNTPVIPISGSGAFDAIIPCPRACDPKSPLNNG